MVRRKTFLISRNLATGTDWLETFNLDFVPDTVVTRSITYSHDLTEVGTFAIRTSLIGGYVGSFYDSDSTHLLSQIPYKAEAPKAHIDSRFTILLGN